MLSVSIGQRQRDGSRSGLLPGSLDFSPKRSPRRSN
jgi:hypothetical protein